MKSHFIEMCQVKLINPTEKLKVGLLGGKIMMRDRMLFLTVTVLLLLLCASHPAKAFNVTPMLMEINAVAGTSYTGSFTVSGAETESERVNIYPTDWDKLPNGDDLEYAPGTMERSCSNWLSISPTRSDIPAGGKVSVKYSFTVPQDASGSYWTFIMVEGEQKPMKPSDNSDQMQVAIEARFRYAARMFINVGTGGRVRGQINGIDVAPPSEKSAFKDSPLEAKVVFQNTGDTLLKPQGYIEIRNMDGVTENRVEIPPRFYVIPGKERWLVMPIDKHFEDGEYLALAVLDYGGENLVAGEKHFSIPVAVSLETPKKERDSDAR
jgi:hypothetical protein